MTKRKYEKANITWLNESDKLESNVIYLLTFNDNGKEMYYVGKTANQLRDRIGGYYPILPNPKSLVQQAISKLKHFTISILCKCNTKEELKVKEEYYTLQYRSNEIEFGYNENIGNKLSQRLKDNLRDTHLGRDAWNKGLKGVCISNKRIKVQSIPDNIIFESISKCLEYYRICDNVFYNNLNNGKYHKRTGQTFITL